MLGTLLMTKKSPHGTISTKAKVDNIIYKVQTLLKAGKLRLSSHANQRMYERNVIYYELLQALTKCKHEAGKDRFSIEHDDWQYSLVGRTLDDRQLRIGVSFETDENTGETLLIVTVIDIT